MSKAGWSVPPLAVGIAGAGIAGLSLALRLAGLGRRSIVLEARSREALASDGAFLGLAPNAINALRPIGLAEAVVASGVITTGIEILDERGVRLGFADQADHAAAFGAPSITIARGTLMRILLDAAERTGIDIRFETRVEDLRETADGVRVATRDGEEIGLQWLAACDGIGSQVRRRVFPAYPEPHFTGLIGTGGMADGAGIPSTGGALRLVFGHVGFFGYLKGGDGPLFWFNSYPAACPDAGPDKASAIAWLRALHRSDPEPIDTILAGVRELERDFPIFDMPPVRVWSSGRVVLLGDAAHAVGPHAGQGAAMAIEDAMTLAACIAQEADPRAAFPRYEALRRPRIAAVARLTARNRAQKRASTRLERLVRRLLLPLLLPGAFRASRVLFAYRVDADPDLEVPAPGSRPHRATVEMHP